MTSTRRRDKLLTSTPISYLTCFIFIIPVFLGLFLAKLPSLSLYHTKIVEMLHFLPCTDHAFLWLHEGSVQSIHLVVESAGITQVVASAIAAPQRRGHCATVHTLTPLTEKLTVFCTHREGNKEIM